MPKRPGILQRKAFKDGPYWQVEQRKKGIMKNPGRQLQKKGKALHPALKAALRVFKNHQVSPDLIDAA